LGRKRSRPACRCARKRCDLRWGETGRFLLRSDLLLQAAPSLWSPGATRCSSLAAWSSGLTVTAVTRALTVQVPSWSSGCGPMQPRRHPDGAARCYGAHRLAGLRMLTPWTRGGPAHGRGAELTRLTAACGSRARPPSAVHLGLPEASAHRPRPLHYRGGAAYAAESTVDTQEESRAPWMMSSQTILPSDG
jgi:hypothetical protein